MEVMYYYVVLLCNLLNTYNLYRFYKHVFSGRKYRRIFEYSSYIAYWIVNGAIYFFLNIPIVTLLSNLCFYYLLTYNYYGLQKQRIFYSLFFGIALMFVESIVVIFTSSALLPVLAQNSYNMISGPIFTTILGYLFVNILIHRKNIRNQIKLPLEYWLVLVLIPTFSYGIVTYLMVLSDAVAIGITICCFAFLFINLSIFFLYDRVIDAISTKKDNELFMQKNSYYEKHLENMKVSVDSTRIMRHDIKNHMIVIASLLEAKKYDELDAYFSNFYANNNFDALIDTGNTAIDSILNFKMQECRNKGIDLNLNIIIPETLQISSNIMVAVLGNLLSNAIEATEKLDHDRVIDCILSFEKGCLHLGIYNAYKGLKKEKDVFVTSKKDKEQHGYGLSSVKEAVERNGGSLTIETDHQRFAVDVVLFNTSDEVL